MNGQVCLEMTKKKGLTSLPEKLPELIRPETGDKISHLWVTFRKIYREINDWSPDNSINDICCEVQDWINTFVSLRGHRVGYERKRVTPYMHILFAHVPHFLASFQSLKIFTGQGVEKNNDSARSVVLHKSNNYDAVGDILRIEHRQRALQEQERTSRSYTKQDTSYWDQDMHATRASKKRRWEETVGIMPLQGSEDPPSSANLNNGLLESNLVETQAISRGNGGVRGRGTGRGRGREGEGKRVSHFHLIIEAFLISQYYF